ncbi:MAG: hypothetical protein WBG86_09600, partial [Polyangiales bacterium]
ATGGAGATGGSGATGGDPGTPALEALAEVPHFAVVSSDFSSTSIAVLDADFVALDESWLNSGTTFPGLVATLSGDVALPNQQAGDGTFAVIDRFSTDVVSRFFVPSGNLNGQVRTQGELGMSGFSSNPQDLVFVDETSAWVTRLGVNLDDTAPPENQGTDLLQINPTTMTLTGGRVDLSSFNTIGTVMTDQGPVDVIVYARPNRAVRVDSTVVVGLDRLSLSFDAAGPGMVAVVDLDDESATGLLLGSGFANCGNATPVPGAASKVVVSCQGFAANFGDEGETRASAGVLLLDVTDGEVTIETTWRASTDEDSAIAVNELIAIDDTRVAGVAYGNFVDTTDALYITDITSGDQELVYTSLGSFEIGTSAWDPDAELLFVPDGVESAVIEYALTESGPMEVGSVELAPGLGLPPRKVYLLE